MRHRARELASRGPAYLWAAPNTALGLAAGLLMLALGARMQMTAGTAEFAGGALGCWAGALPGPWRFGAMTLGHVIIGISPGDLAALRPHEQAHVRQYEQWGPFFLPAYALSSAWQVVCGRSAHTDNFFEREARAAAQSVTTALVQPVPETQLRRSL